MLDDTTVVGEGGFLGSIVRATRVRFAIEINLGLEPLPSLGHSTVLRGAGGRRFSFSFLAAAHSAQ